MKPFGVRGEIRVRPSDIGPDHLLQRTTLWLGAEAPPDRGIRLLSGRSHKDSLLVRLEGIDSPEAARTLTGLDIWLPRDQLPPLEEGVYYWDDLLGLSVVTEMAEPLGVVENLIATGANDVIIVREPGGGERLLPLIDEVVRGVDLEKGIITVRLMAGM